jgi:hypothetical protein
VSKHDMARALVAIAAVGFVAACGGASRGGPSRPGSSAASLPATTAGAGSTRGVSQYLGTITQSEGGTSLTDEYFLGSEISTPNLGGPGFPLRAPPSGPPDLLLAIQECNARDTPPDISEQDMENASVYFPGYVLVTLNSSSSQEITFAYSGNFGGNNDISGSNSGYVAEAIELRGRWYCDEPPTGSPEVLMIPGAPVKVPIWLIAEVLTNAFPTFNANEQRQYIFTGQIAESNQWQGSTNVSVAGPHAVRCTSSGNSPQLGLTIWGNPPYKAESANLLGLADCTAP